MGLVLGSHYNVHEHTLICTWPVGQMLKRLTSMISEHIMTF